MDHIGKYRIVRILGEGGMGRVYEAADPIINRRVAIKTISQPVLQDPDARARFLREAQAAGQLSHPNVITIHDIAEEEGAPFLVMEYLEGEDLSRLIAAGQVSLDDRLRIMCDVCEGLAYAHGRGLVHRDIKPPNIFVTTGRQVKILDFGLARGVISELTQTGRVVGTPSYMAPEQVRGEPVDQRADIFSAGTVLYELLSGQKAFKGDSVAATIFQVLDRQPEPLENVVPSLPPGLGDVVRRSMEKDPAARYQHVDEMLADLTRIRIEQQPTTALLRDPSPWPSTPARVTGVMRPPSGSAGTSSRSGTPSPTPSRMPSTPAASVSAAGTPAPSSAILAPPPAAAVTPAPATAPTPMPGSVPRPRAGWAPWAAAAAVTAAAVGILFLASGRTSRGPDPSAPGAVTTPSGAHPAPPADTRAAEAVPPSAPGQVAAGPPPLPPSAQPTVPPAEAKPPAPRAKPVPPPAPARAANAARTTVPPTTAPTTAVPSSSAPSTVVPTTVAPTSVVPEAPKPPPAPVVPVPPPTTAPAVAPPPAPTTIDNPAAGINETLNRYKGALEARDVDALRRIWPGLGGRQEAALRSEFENARTITVNLQGISSAVTNGSATVTCRRDYVVTTVDGRTLRSSARMVVTMNRHNGSWVIDNIRYEAER